MGRPNKEEGSVSKAKNGGKKRNSKKKKFQPSYYSEHDDVSELSNDHPAPSSSSASASASSSNPIDLTLLSSSASSARSFFVVQSQNGESSKNSSSDSSTPTKKLPPSIAAQAETNRRARQLKLAQVDAQALQRIEKETAIEKVMGPLHDPNAKRALILYPPAHKFVPQGKVQVVVDPRLSAVLGPAQRIGVQKMYDYLTQEGSTIGGGERGFILADKMGLGKTLQCITVLWTLLTQSPDWSLTTNQRKTHIKKAIIVCPATVVRVWRDEINDWLVHTATETTQMDLCVIDDTIKPAEKKKEMAEDFMDEDNGQQCMIVSYNTFDNLTKTYEPGGRHDSESIMGPLARNWGNVVQLMICDEAHYIKNDIQRTSAIEKFKVKMKIAVTGTPLQNNLKEYYNILSYVHPAFAADYDPERFARELREPIERFIEDRTYLPGRSALHTLQRIVRPFFLRRTKNPFVYVDKTEYIVCVNMDQDEGLDLQLTLYNEFVQCYHDQQLQDVEDPDADAQDEGEVPKKKRRRSKKPKPKIYVTPLQAINFLKQLTSHPDLVQDKLRDWRKQKTPLFDQLYPLWQSYGVTEFEPNFSAKMRWLLRFLRYLRQTEETRRDRVVIVSYQILVLEMIENALDLPNLMYDHVRFDGSTTTGAQREKIRKNFNNWTKPDHFIMMLSCKAGGVGISITGANHLVMFDPDWNPANDEQVMERIYRKGQKKNCHIYRLLTTGSIEESQFKRQIFKKMLAGQIMGDSGGSGYKNDQFSREDKQCLMNEIVLYDLEENRPLVSLTHADLNCSMCDLTLLKQMRDPTPAEREYKENSDALELHLWSHIYKSDNLPTESKTLAKTWKHDERDISMVFLRKSKGAIKPDKKREDQVGVNEGQEEEDEEY